MTHPFWPVVQVPPYLYGSPLGPNSLFRSGFQHILASGVELDLVQDSGGKQGGGT
jgi:hypothetical protein